MKKLTMTLVGMLLGGVVQAENLEGVDEMICAATQVQICIEDDTCYSSSSAELGMPDFVLIDTQKKTISTTKASGQNRSSKINSVEEVDGLVILQGVEGGRAFSFVIHVETGRMTVAVSRDGLSVSVFGVCTDSDL